MFASGGEKGVRAKGWDPIDRALRTHRMGARRLRRSSHHRAIAAIRQIDSYPAATWSGRRERPTATATTTDATRPPAEQIPNIPGMDRAPAISPPVAEPTIV